MLAPIFALYGALYLRFRSYHCVTIIEEGSTSVNAKWR